MIRILHLIKGLGNGGAEVLLKTTLAHHDLERFQFHYGYFLPWKNALVPALERSNVNVTCFTAKNQFGMLKETVAITRYIKRHNINLIHAHLPWAGIVASIAGKLANVPVVYTEHNTMERYHPLTRMVNKWAYKFYERVITVSEDAKKATMKQFGNNSPVVVDTLHNGVDTSLYTYQDATEKNRAKEVVGINKSSYVISTAAVFRQQKRLDRWLIIAKHFLDKYPDATFILIGTGPLQQQVNEWIKELGLGSKIVLPGMQSDIKPWLSATDVFLIASDYEGLPVALLEAMSMGCVPVVSKVGGMPEVVNTDCGYVYPKDEIEVAVSALEALYLDRDKLSRFSISASERIKNYFSLDQMVRGLEEIYEGVVGSRL